MAGAWDALGRRVRVMHELWGQAVADLSLAQVNHHERTGVLPIAFSLMHYVNGEDRSVATFLLVGETIWSDEWATRIGIGAAVPRGTPLAAAEELRITDLDGWREYQTTVFARTDAALANLPAERWNEIVFSEMPDRFKGGFLDLLLDGGAVPLGDLMDVLLYQHGMRHLGEIEHARSLVGLQGVG